MIKHDLARRRAMGPWFLAICDLLFVICDSNMSTLTNSRRDFLKTMGAVVASIISGAMPDRGVYQHHLAELKQLATEIADSEERIADSGQRTADSVERTEESNLNDIRYTLNANKNDQAFTPPVRDRSGFKQAAENGRLANEGFVRCRNFVKGWLKHADPKTGLIPRNLNRDKDIWNAKDSAADNYPFMVLTAAITDQPLFEGRMLDMLRTETRLTSRIASLPDTYSFSKQSFHDTQPDIDRIIFGSSEYIKDGLLPLTEWLGPGPHSHLFANGTRPNPWCERMIAMLDDIWKHAPIETKYGKIPSVSQEVNGEMLQTLSRIYWMTGEKKYLDWAIRLGDYYLLDGHHPTKHQDRLSLDDHGCEIISGLCELYATVNFAKPAKKRAYQKPIHEMLDRILELGTDEHGLFYDSVNLQTGQHADELTDNWGYDLNGFYTVYLIDKTQAYRQAVRKALGNLNTHYSDYKWERGGADGYADSIEGAINLYNREPVPTAVKWLDSQTRIMWNIQKPDGIIEGWHGDGNFARTTIMYCLWKTKGLTITPWRDDVLFGAVQDGDILKISIRADKDWQGKFIFDTPRHQTIMKIPLNWPRINQFPEWFTVEAEKRYTVHHLTSDSASNAGHEQTALRTATYTGEQLREGMSVECKSGAQLHLLVKPAMAEEHLEPGSHEPPETAAGDSQPIGNLCQTSARP